MLSRRELRPGIDARLSLRALATAAQKGHEETKHGGTNNHEDEDSHCEG